MKKTLNTTCFIVEGEEVIECTLGSLADFFGETNIDEIIDNPLFTVFFEYEIRDGFPKVLKKYETREEAQQELDDVKIETLWNEALNSSFAVREGDEK